MPLVAAFALTLTGRGGITPVASDLADTRGKPHQLKANVAGVGGSEAERCSRVHKLPVVRRPQLATVNDCRKYMLIKIGTVRSIKNIAK